MTEANINAPVGIDKHGRLVFLSLGRPVGRYYVKTFGSMALDTEIENTLNELAKRGWQPLFTMQKERNLTRVVFVRQESEEDDDG